jgi:hypothetical protein
LLLEKARVISRLLWDGVSVPLAPTSQSGSDNKIKRLETRHFCFGRPFPPSYQIEAELADIGHESVQQPAAQMHKCEDRRIERP